MRVASKGNPLWPRRLYRWGKEITVDLADDGGLVATCDGVEVGRLTRSEVAAGRNDATSLVDQWLGRLEHKIRFMSQEELAALP